MGVFSDIDVSSSCRNASDLLQDVSHSSVKAIELRQRRLFERRYRRDGDAEILLTTFCWRRHRQYARL